MRNAQSFSSFFRSGCCCCFNGVYISAQINGIRAHKDDYPYFKCTMMSIHSSVLFSVSFHFMICASHTVKTAKQKHFVLFLSKTEFLLFCSVPTFFCVLRINLLLIRQDIFFSLVAALFELLTLFFYFGCQPLHFTEIVHRCGTRCILESFFQLNYIFHAKQKWVKKKRDERTEWILNIFFSCSEVKSEMKRMEQERMKE